jgi:hypothetical protein
VLIFSPASVVAELFVTSQNKGWKTNMGTMLPSGDRIWQQIYRDCIGDVLVALYLPWLLGHCNNK